MKLFTFMVEGYNDYEPSDFEYLYDEDRFWETSWCVIASSKEEAMHKLKVSSFNHQERTIIDEDRIHIENIPFDDDEDNRYFDYSGNTYQIVRTSDIRLGVDFVEEDIRIINKTFISSEWGSVGKEKTTTYFFSDDFQIKEISRKTTGWSESETLLIGNNKQYTIRTHGEDTYNSGDKNINTAQSPRFKAINTFDKLEDEKRRKKESSLLKAKEAVRETFLEREMPYLIVENF